MSWYNPISWFHKKSTPKSKGGGSKSSSKPSGGTSTGGSSSSSSGSSFGGGYEVIRGGQGYSTTKLKKGDIVTKTIPRGKSYGGGGGGSSSKGGGTYNSATGVYTSPSGVKQSTPKAPQGAKIISKPSAKTTITGGLKPIKSYPTDEGKGKPLMISSAGLNLNQGYNYYKPSWKESLKEFGSEFIPTMGHNIKTLFTGKGMYEMKNPFFVFELSEPLKAETIDYSSSIPGYYPHRTSMPSDKLKTYGEEWSKKGYKIPSQRTGFFSGGGISVASDIGAGLTGFINPIIPTLYFAGKGTALAGKGQKKDIPIVEYNKKGKINLPLYPSYKLSPETKSASVYLGFSGLGGYSLLKSKEKSIVADELERLSQSPIGTKENPFKVISFQGKKGGYDILTATQKLGNLKTEINVAGKYYKIGNKNYFVPLSRGYATTSGELGYNILGGKEGSNILSSQTFNVGAKGVSIPLNEKTTFNFGKSVLEPTSGMGTIYHKPSPKVFNEFVKSFKIYSGKSAKPTIVSFDTSISKKLVNAPEEGYKNYLITPKGQIVPKLETWGTLTGSGDVGITKIIKVPEAPKVNWIKKGFGGGKTKFNFPESSQVQTQIPKQTQGSSPASLSSIESSLSNARPTYTQHLKEMVAPSRKMIGGIVFPKQKSINKQVQTQIPKQTFKTKSSFLPSHSLKHKVTQIQSPSLMNGLVNIPKPKLKQTPVQTSKSVSSSYSPSIKSPVPFKNPLPKIPFYIPRVHPQLSKPSGVGKMGLKEIFGYSPSFAGFKLGIKGLTLPKFKLPSGKKVYTGFEVRGIPKGKMFKINYKKTKSKKTKKKKKKR